MKLVVALMTLFVLAGCGATEKHTTFMIDKAYLSGNVLSLHYVFPNKNNYQDFQDGQYPPTIYKALSVDNFTLVSDSQVLNRYVTPQDVSIMTLHINPSADLGTTSTGGVDTYAYKYTFSFSSDQLTSVPLYNCVYVVVPTTDSNVLASLQAHLDSRFSSIRSFHSQNVPSGIAYYFDYQRIDYMRYSGLPIYVEETTKSPSSIFYIDSTATKYSTATVFDSTINFSPGVVVNLGNCTVE